MQSQPRFTIIFQRDIVAPATKCLGHGFTADARTTIYRSEGKIVWTIVSWRERVVPGFAKFGNLILTKKRNGRKLSIAQARRLVALHRIRNFNTELTYTHVSCWRFHSSGIFFTFLNVNVNGMFARHT